VKIHGGVSRHPAKNRRHVLDRMTGDGQNAVTAFIHGVIWHGTLRYFWLGKRWTLGSLSNSKRCPEREYNPFPGVGGCAKLLRFRLKCNREAVDRGLRFTVSVRTGAVFLGDCISVSVIFGRSTGDFLRNRCSSQNSFTYDPAPLGHAKQKRIRYVRAFKMGHDQT
jgi:hypothetical protein